MTFRTSQIGVLVLSLYVELIPVTLVTWLLGLWSLHLSTPVYATVGGAPTDPPLCPPLNIKQFRHLMHDAAEDHFAPWVTVLGPSGLILVHQNVPVVVCCLAAFSVMLTLVQLMHYWPTTGRMAHLADEFRPAMLLGVVVCGVIFFYNLYHLWYPNLSQHITL